jgi:hypothetical protein
MTELDKIQEELTKDMTVEQLILLKQYLRAYHQELMEVFKK